jgi:hypothetical protein
MDAHANHSARKEDQMEESKIAWTDHTFNPWIGCSHESEGCRNCYAETQNAHYHWNGGAWGPGAPRKITSDDNWRNPVRWDRAAQAHGKRAKVFCASLADVFDPEAPAEARVRLWELILQTPNFSSFCRSVGRCRVYPVVNRSAPRTPPHHPPASAVSACKSLSPPFRWTNTPGGIPARRRTRFYEY